jgi:hypothetical protein
MRKAAPVLIFMLIALLPGGCDGTTTAAADAAVAAAAGTATTPAAAAAAGTAPAAGSTAAATNTEDNGGSLVMDLSVPKDTRTHWSVAVCTFEVEGLSGENRYLAFSLPLLLKNEVGALSTHTLSDEERDLVRRRLIARDMVAADKAATAACAERDALLFSDAVASAKDSAARSAVEKKLADAVKRHGFLASLDPSKVDVAAEKPVAFKQGVEEGKLLDAPLIPRDVYCAQQGVDLLVGGSLQEVQGYLLLDIWAFDAARGRMVFTSRNAAQREELYAFLSSLGKELAGVILGRQWSLVSFAPKPPESALYVDGVLAASGASSTLYLAPGAHAVRMTAPGYRDVERTLTLAEGEETRIEDELEKEVPGQVEFTSDPDGAAVYVGSVWKGVTPLFLDVPAVQSRGELKLDGFYSQPFTLDSAVPPSVSLALTPDTGSRDDVQKKKRDDFYFSLGLFAFSIPLPLFSYALALDYSVKWLECVTYGLSDEASSAKSSTYVFLGTYYAGIAISVSLFSWMVSRIVTYVKAANDVGGMKEGY